jgi:hypothetical protein
MGKAVKWDEMTTDELVARRKLMQNRKRPLDRHIAAVWEELNRRDDWLGTGVFVNGRCVETELARQEAETSAP